MKAAQRGKSFLVLFFKKELLALAVGWGAQGHPTLQGVR
jgi:hypothetical protein